MLPTRIAQQLKQQRIPCAAIHDASTVNIGRRGRAHHPSSPALPTKQAVARAHPSITRQRLSRWQLHAQATYSPASIAGDTYLCLGLSHCFEKDEANKLTDRYIIEPVSASSLECMANGARTSFKAATGVHFKDAVSRNKAALPPPFNEGIYCDNFVVRCEAAARTWLRPHAQDNLMDLVPLGKVKGNFNFNLDDKRVLNFENLVSDSDNIKQDISIDVYGRAEQAEKEAQEAKAAEEKAAAAAAAAAPLVAEDSDDDDDDLDALLAA